MLTTPMEEALRQALAEPSLAAAIVLALLGAQAADLVVWWQKGAYAQEELEASGRSSPPLSREAESGPS